MRRPPRLVSVALAALVSFAPRSLPAQGVATPRPSVLWSTAPATPADSTRASTSQGWNQSKGALAGGLIGAAAGMAGGLWVCRHSGSFGSGGCTGDVLWGGALFGALGLLLGALAGHDAER